MLHITFYFLLLSSGQLYLFVGHMIHLLAPTFYIQNHGVANWPQIFAQRTIQLLHLLSFASLFHQGWPHCHLRFQSRNTNGDWSNARANWSLEDSCRIHGDHWQREAHPDVSSHEHLQSANEVKGRVSASTQNRASRYGKGSTQKKIIQDFWGAFRKYGACMCFWKRLLLIFCLIRWAPQMCADVGHFCRMLSPRGKKTLLKSCLNLGEFVCFLQRPILWYVRVDASAVCEGNPEAPMYTVRQWERWYDSENRLNRISGLCRFNTRCLPPKPLFDTKLHSHHGTRYGFLCKCPVFDWFNMFKQKCKSQERCSLSWHSSLRCQTTSSSSNSQKWCTRVNRRPRRWRSSRRYSAHCQ